MGSSTGDGTSDTSTSNASPMGVWSGTDSVSGLAVTALINSDGQATFIRADGAQFVGNAEMSGSNLSVAVDGYSNFGQTFSDGATAGVGTVTGTVVTASSLSATLSFTTSDETAITGNWSLSYDALSTLGSSLAAVSANYTTSTGATVSIDGLGDVDSQDPTTGCILSGTISTTDKSVDIYQITLMYKSCAGNDAVLNGVEFSGMAVLNSNISPAQLVLAVTASPTSGSMGIVSYLNAT
jgi:hypothetical protein